MRRLVVLRALAGALVLVGGGCAKPEAGPLGPTATQPGILAAKQGPAPQDSVTLGMTVAEATDLRIWSDGLGEYVNGVSGMAATIDRFGNLQIGPANAASSTPPLRRLDVRHGDGLVYTFPAQWSFKIKSNRTNNGNPRIQDMAVGAALCYNVTISHRTQAIAYQADFNRAINAGARYALISRAGPDQWTVTSRGDATTGLDCGPADMAFLEGTDLTVKRGNFTIGLGSLSFSISLRRLP